MGCAAGKRQTSVVELSLTTLFFAMVTFDVSLGKIFIVNAERSEGVSDQTTLVMNF